MSSSNAWPDGWNAVTPRLVARDPAALVAFIQSVFDASGDLQTHVPTILRIGDSNVMISGDDARAATRAFLYVYVADVDAVYRRALDAGATSIEPPQKTPYGDRRAMVTDPFGNDWQIATKGDG